MSKTFLDLQNLRASKVNEPIASKIHDVDLARFYNETIADMAKQGQKIKKVTTNIVANQAEYGESVLPGFVATALVKVGETTAPFIGIEDYAFESDRATTRHTVVNNSVVLLPVPTTAQSNGLKVHYWAKLPEIIDAAVAETELVDLDDKDWNVATLGVTLKMYEKLIATSLMSKELIPDANITALVKVVEYFSKKYADALDTYGNAMRFFHAPTSTKGTATRDNEIPSGIGRQSGRI
jgi:hypothetical protein